MTLPRLLAWAPALAAAAGLSACACPRRCPDPCAPAAPAPAAAAAPTPAPTAAPAPRPDPFPPVGAIVDLRAGRVVSFDAMVESLAKVPVVYVGEQHDQVEHHAFQTRVLRALAERPGGKIALGMEMFYRPFQAHLDAYVRGEIDEKTMLEKTDWPNRWGFGWDMYAPMVRYCREKGIPVVALNAPKEVTRTVSQKGLDGLPEDLRASLPALDLTDQAHRAFVKRAFGAHGAAMPEERFERFYTSMVIWDETMSSSVAEWLDAAGEGARMVVVAGNGHIADRYGIPARAARKTGKPYLTVVTENRPPKGQVPPDAEPNRMDPTWADFSAWFLPSPFEKPAPKEAPKGAAPAAPKVQG